MRLPLTLLARYLFFLSRRPISSSNQHFRNRRLASLRALLKPLEGCDARPWQRARPTVERLNAENFQRLLPEILHHLMPALPDPWPPHYLVSRRSPGPRFFDDIERLMVVFGPAIGIGDEVLCARFLPRLRRAAPRADLCVLSAYPDLAHVAEDDSTTILRYEDLAEVVERLRQSSSTDLLVWIDFEKPALLGAMAAEKTQARYVELALGARWIACFDRAAERVAEYQPSEAYFSNFYNCLDHLGDWFFEGTGGAERQRHTSWIREGGGQTSPSTETTLFVSPFTSKYEPREDRWHRLLEPLGHAPTPLRLLLDPGSNRSTARFSRRLARSLAGTAGARGHLRCELAQGRQPGTLNLDEAIALLDPRGNIVDAVICTDSYAAHIASRAGLPTLVLAGQGLENWRAPDVPTFYFDENAPISRNAAALQLVLARFLGLEPSWWPSELARSLEQITEDLDSQLATAPDLDHVLSRYRRLCQKARRLDLKGRPLATTSLLASEDPASLLPLLPEDSELIWHADDLRIHLRHQIDLWKTSNLWKWLRFGPRAETT